MAVMDEKKQPRKEQECEESDLDEDLLDENQESYCAEDENLSKVEAVPEITLKAPPEALPEYEVVYPDISTKVPPANLEQIAALGDQVQQMADVMEKLNETFGNLESKTETVEKDLKKDLDRMEGTFLELFQSFSKTVQQKMDSIEKALVFQQDNLNDTIKRGFEIERKLDNVRSIASSQNESPVSTRRVKVRSSKGTFPGTWALPFFGVPSFGARIRTGKRPVSFDLVERKVRSGNCTGQQALELLHKLRDSHGIDKNDKFDDIRRILRAIELKVELEEHQFLTGFTREFVLNQLDRAEILWRAMHRKHKKILKKQIRDSLTRILRRVKTNPLATHLKDHIEDFREMLQDSEFKFDENFFREIRNVEQFLISKGTSRVDSLDAENLYSEISRWDSHIEALLPESVLTVFDPALMWLKETIKALEDGPKNPQRRDIYELYLLLMKKASNIKKMPHFRGIRSEFEGLLADLDKILYDKITLDQARFYFDKIQKWKKFVLKIKGGNEY